MLSSILFWGLIALIGTSKGSYPFTHSMNPHLQPRLYHGCYGDIMNMEASGVACDITRLMNCGGLSAFKSGIDAIATPEDIDNDLVNDLLARAKFYRRHSF
ncbi:Lysozyme G-Like Protein 2 [Manis pentadactyla]|nr:Lysozyme G-Like Protein 2 [Manis pentadactyla]